MFLFLLRYAQTAFSNLKFEPSQLTAEEAAAGKEMMNDWRNLTTFYTLALLIAPVTETVVLLDRMLYLYEKG